MSERTVTVGGNSAPLEGPEWKVGDTAPNFALQYNGADGMKIVSLADFKGRTLLLSVVPSLDTSVCATQTRTFNQKAVQLPESIALITISMDLPFAQARFCGIEHIDRIQCLSDHQSGEFGRDYGVMIADGPLKRILSRAVFIVGADGRFKYIEYVPEVTSEPNYEAAIAALV